MRKFVIRSYLGGAAISSAILAQFAFSAPAAAQEPAYMSCSELWHARNEIYARNGYCFKTARARSVFGPGCFPPYGHLRGWEKRHVDEIQMWEARKGC